MCTHTPTRLQYSTVEGRQKEMWGDSSLFSGQKKTPIVSECPPFPRLTSPCMPLEVQRKERKRFREREREGGKAGSLCSCSRRGLWITSECLRRKEWEKGERGKEREGHPEKRGHPKEGVRHTPQIRPPPPFFFYHAPFIPAPSLYLSIKGCSGTALHRAIIVVRLKRTHSNINRGEEVNFSSFFIAE